MVRPRNVNKGKKTRQAPDWERQDVFDSRTQIKQAAQAVNDLGERLAQLKAGDLARFELSDEVKEAVDLLRRLDRGPAYKRQKAYLGKLLRRDETQLAHIRAVMAQLAEDGLAAQRLQKRLERWRARLLEEGDVALAELMAQYPHADRNRLRQLIRNARHDNPDKARRAGKMLFQALKQLHQDAESA